MSLLPVSGWAKPIASSAARPLALGTAYIAEDEDVNTLFYNPAGLTGLSGPEVSLNYGRMSLGGLNAITDGQVAYGQPASFQGQAIGAAGGITAQSIMPGVHVVDTFFGVASDINTQGILPWPVRAGGALKLRQEQGQKKDADIGKSSFGFGFDMGALIPFDDNNSLGLALKDLFLGDLNPRGPRLVVGARRKQSSLLLFLADVEVRRNVFALHTGAELGLYRGLLRLRAGNAYQYNGIDHVSLGFGFNFSPAQFDMAYVVPTQSFHDNSGQYRISLIYRFRAARFSELYFDRALDMAEEVDRRVVQLQESEARLKSSIQDLEQARRLAEEDLARASMRNQETIRSSEDRAVQAENRAIESEMRSRELAERVQEAEEKIRRAQQMSAPRPVYRAPEKEEKKETGPRYHTAQAGDSLQSLSQKYYGTPDKWKTIFDANPGKVQKGRPVPGSKLLIP